MTVIIDPVWSFDETVKAAHEAYIGYGITSTGYRNGVLMAWGSVVGRERACAGLTEFITDKGSKKEAADALGISIWSLRKIERHFKSLHEKQSGVPPMVRKLSYDVALSFAGENRAIVEELAEMLLKARYLVFYDKYEQANLWGKDLYTHLSNVYRSARYVIVFISSEYAKKLWTKHELKSAQSKAFEESSEYILPVKLDDTEIPGILPTTGYLDLRKLTVQQIFEILCKKLDTPLLPDDCFPYIQGRLIAVFSGIDSGWVDIIPSDGETKRFSYIPCTDFLSPEELNNYWQLRTRSKFPPSTEDQGKIVRVYYKGTRFLAYQNLCTKY